MYIDPLFAYANYAEACLWTALGIAAITKRNSTASIVLGCALLIFGVSDVIEANTGAWYEPWWLLVMKTACVVCILLSGRMVLRRRRENACHAQQPV
ncbi:MAG: hypothetical protein H7144_10865 [Burkholderiales bacterium]|nr:hypothetical protein [Phycisphaerae bacterium]